VVSLKEDVGAAVRPALVAFAIAAAIVLLIACANVATILVGRTLGRGRELAVRRALGATPRQLLAGVIAESVLVTTAGAVLGIVIAVVSVRLVTQWAAGIVPRLSEIQVDWVALAFAVGSTVVAALLSALPAFRITGLASATLRVSGAGSARIDRRTRGTLIVAQIALAVVLLAGGTLLARTIVGLLNGELGVTAHGTVVSQLMLTSGTSFSAADRGPLLDQVLDRIRSLPGVRAAGAGSNLPPDNSSIEMRVRLTGPNGEQVHHLSLGSATPGYLPALGARIVDGRDFARGDEGAERIVAVISESAARSLMPEFSSPVGRELPMSVPGLRARGRPRVIGVVRDIRYSGLHAPADATVYVMWSELAVGRMFLAVRTDLDPGAVASSLRAILREHDSRQPLLPVRTLEEVVARSVADRRFRAWLGGSVALLAFAVAMVGLAGSLIRIVSERRAELAIRAALGATPARAVWTIVSEGATVAFIGVAVGGVGALAAGRALRTLLHGVSPHDPVTLAGVCAFVAGVSVLTCYGAARRAARVDPLILLRAE
jgi:predicted permease